MFQMSSSFLEIAFFSQALQNKVFAFCYFRYLVFLLHSNSSGKYIKLVQIVELLSTVEIIFINSSK